VVAHALAVIAVQSGVGSHVIDTNPDEAKRVLDRINDASVETLDEMRRMLGVLRGGDGEGADLAPAPGLADVDQLVEGVRNAGLSVEMDVTGDPDRIPAGVALTAFRVVQEALTNVLKHAGPARVQVHIGCEPGVVTVEVEDDGRGAAADLDDAPGHHLGVIGMRERIAAYDGRLDVGPRTGGGWRVRATLPFDRVNA
jgi:signal transduction histidine kinase